MSQSELVYAACALAWFSGVFFGLGLERKLLAKLRARRHVNSTNSEHRGPQPLPMREIEVAKSPGSVTDPSP